jgi:hypothetical protein
MDSNSYLVISNVFTGFVLLMTCGVTIWRRRIISCPFCYERMSDLELRTHIQICTEHNNLYMGRFSPVLRAVPVQLPEPFPYPLAIAVPLPQQQYQNYKVADL